MCITSLNRFGRSFKTLFQVPTRPFRTLSSAGSVPTPPAVRIARNAIAIPASSHLIVLVLSLGFNSSSSIAILDPHYPGCYPQPNLPCWRHRPQRPVLGVPEPEARQSYAWHVLRKRTVRGARA